MTDDRTRADEIAESAAVLFKERAVLEAQILALDRRILDKVSEYSDATGRPTTRFGLEISCATRGYL